MSWYPVCFEVFLLLTAQLASSLAANRPPLLYIDYLPLPYNFPSARYRSDFSFDAANLKSLDGWTLTGTTRIVIDNIVNKTVELTTKDVWQAGSIYCRRDMPYTSIFRNWRLEVIFSSSRTSSKSESEFGSPAFGLFLANPRSIKSSLVDDRLGHLEGFLAWLPIWYEENQFISSFTKYAYKAFPAFDGNLGLNFVCGRSLTSDQLSKRVVVILQYVDEQLTMAIGPAGDPISPMDSTVCFGRRRLPGFASLIANGGVTIGVGGFTQGSFAVIKVHSVTFFTLEASAAPETTTVSNV